MSPRSRAERHLRHLKMVVVAASVMPAFGCDPMPEPAQCTTVDPLNWAYATATWTAVGTDGAFEVVFRMTVDTYSVAGIGRGTITATGATVTAIVPEGGDVVVHLTLAEGSDQVVVSVPFTCPQAPTTMIYTISVDPTLPDGSDLPMTEVPS